MKTFTYLDPKTGKKQTFNYNLPKAPNIPIGGFPIKQVAIKYGNPVQNALKKALV